MFMVTFVGTALH